MHFCYPNSLIILAGLSATKTLGGTSFVTTLPAAITLFVPMVIPFFSPQTMIEFAPIHTLSSTTIGFAYQQPSNLFFESSLCPEV